jgi:hypothetical protein
VLGLVFDREIWSEDVNCQLVFGENDVRKMSVWLQLNERCTIHGFCDCLIQKIVLEKLKHFKSTQSVIPILSSVCERGFS